MHFVRIDTRRGVKICGLWYGARSPVLEPYRGRLSGRGGRHAGKWAVHRDSRNCRQISIELDGAWQELLWNGLPPGEEVPAFSDVRVGDVLRQAAKARLKPRSDAELLPVLLGLVAAKTPVDTWPTQMTRQQKTDRARELDRASAAALTGLHRFRHQGRHRKRNRLCTGRRPAPPPYGRGPRPPAAPADSPWSRRERVARAEREGLVTRQSGTGRPRTVQVTLTTAGHDLVEVTVDQVLLREAELIGGLTPDQRNRLTELLHLLLTDVQQRIGDDRITQVGGEE